MQTFITLNIERPNRALTSLTALKDENQQGPLCTQIRPINTWRHRVCMAGGASHINVRLGRGIASFSANGQEGRISRLHCCESQSFQTIDKNSASSQNTIFLYGYELLMRKVCQDKLCRELIIMKRFFL